MSAPATAPERARETRAALGAPAPPPGAGGDLFPAVPPTEVRGLPRDGVRMLVARRDGPAPVHARLTDLPAFLRPGDLLVVNASAVLPAALDARRADGTPLRLHLSTELGRGRWLVEPRRPRGDASLPWSSGDPEAGGPPAPVHAGERLVLPGGGQAQLLRPHGRAAPPGTPAAGGIRLWSADVCTPAALERYLARHGRPIRYGDPAQPWPLAAYQTVFAAEPGSAESPSAGRGFTRPLLRRLARRGVTVARLVLHTGVSSQESGEPPYPERYRVPEDTAAAVNAARRAGRRVVAVGTTVTRALETVADPDGTVRAGHGWTTLEVTPERGVRAVDGLLSGWHEPTASHLRLLEAVAGASTLARAYETGAAARYHGHEFGDLLLVLPA